MPANQWESGQQQGSSTARQTSGSPANATGAMAHPPEPTEASANAAPTITLPKGGGAIRGIGEKFGVNPVTGTASLTVPIVTSPGRSGFGPQLALSYDSGEGNGPFGIGWSLSLPAITRKTDKGLPRYRDFEESDTFILSGAEDLVPVFKKDKHGEWVRDHDGNLVIDDPRGDYMVRTYRPRVEGLFARIERWTRKSDGDVYWRSISKDNVATLYGKTPESRIADPADSTRVFSWLICQSYDDKGNATVYTYVPEDVARIFEDPQGQPVALAHERNRNNPERRQGEPLPFTNRYLKRIMYGNRAPNRDAHGNAFDPAQLTNWMFEVVFDYGEGHFETLPTDDDGRAFVAAHRNVPDGTHWPVRRDPFSSYRAGFEIRTYRLCRRVLMFHHFPLELGTDDCLVRSTEFAYAESPIASVITSVSQSGYRLQPDQNHPERYLKRSLPPLEFAYSQIPDSGMLAEQPIEIVEGESLENLPHGLDGAISQCVDLDGEGLCGILTEQDGAWFYKRNTSANNQVHENGSTRTVARFGAAERFAVKPGVSLAGGQAQFMDLAGDGQVDVVQTSGAVLGFYERTGDDGWESFRPFVSWPNIDSRDPNLRFVDLNGDGHADILITGEDALIWYPSLAEDGYGCASSVACPLDEEEGPRLVFADGTESIYLADISGDGLSDLARIRNGDVCYWPNLGYGRFGAKVTMDNPPWFDYPDQFKQQRIRLADIDGSGVTDIIYLAASGARIYLNQSGNRWSDAVPLPQFSAIDDLATVQVLDLLGNGTACLVWSSPLPGNDRQPMRYVNLMDSQKPHLLVTIKNNLGVETRITYAPSTRFFLEDRRLGRPWISCLPFPVHVVERVETYDFLSRNCFVTRYAYHHGYFDGVEREFRGFGMVEQWDTEEFAALSASDDFLSSENIDPASHVPPVHTKTWFHTGFYQERQRISTQFAREYYGAPAPDVSEYERKLEAFMDTDLLPDTVLPGALTADEEREACRALKGSMLRREVYAQDGTDKEKHPYTVVEQNFTIRPVQPRAGNRHAVFFTHPCEAISYHYERNPDDPRIAHTLTLEVDDFGNVLKEAAIGYGRKPGQSPLQGQDKTNQEQTRITYTENRVTNPIDDFKTYPDDYRTPLPAETRTYELTGYEPGAGWRFHAGDFIRQGTNDLILDEEIDYEEQPTHGKQRRLIEQVRTLYRKDDLTMLLGLAEVEPLALPGESYKLALTPGLLAKVFTRKRAGQPDEDLLPDPGPLLEGTGSDQGGYAAMDGMWWIPSGRLFFDPDADSVNPADTAAQELRSAREHFFLTRKVTDPFGQSTTMTYDGPADPNAPRYDLLLTHTSDALGNTVTAVNDYRVLQPRLVTDPNRNRSAAAFDTLGLVVATAVMGKEGEDLGDLLEDFDADPPLSRLQAFIVGPESQAASLLSKATTRIVYDLDRYQRAGQPPFAATLARETHVHDPGGDQTRVQISFSYSDGFAREIQKKVQAEPGDAPQRQAPVSLAGGDIRPGELVRDVQGALVPANTPHRWVGTGRTVFNNKGKPVRQYEPFFSATHLFEPEPEMTDSGVSSILFYDPVERVVAVLHPDHTYEKIVFDPWQQTTYDVNDTVAAHGEQTGDPRTDPDIAGYVREYFKTQPGTWQTWYAQRIGSQLGAAEQDAAQKAAAHAGTPTIAHLDALGRTFLRLADNGPDPAQPDQHLRFATCVELDIEGNQRAVIDAKDRIVMRYDYDMLGSRIHQSSMEAGERWLLNDVTGKPIHTWDSRRFARRMTYDELRRPTGLYVTESGVERLAERTVYGEGQGDARNHRTRVYQVHDGAGTVTNEHYDFKGNLLAGRRDLLPGYKQAVDWLQNPAANDGSFTSHSTFDALNRPLTVTTPDGSVYRPTFNEANLLDKVDVNLRGAAASTPFVTNIDYDAKGRRERIAYGNGALTTYEYDPLTFRLIHLKTTRAAGLNGVVSQIFVDPATVQDVHYTYDPAGNITRIEDAALKTVFHDGQQVDPTGSYTYDALYRLIEARGREHIGQTAFDFDPSDGNYRDYPFAGNRAHPNDLQALRNYTERYEYDAAGNFAVLRHLANGGGWTRSYDYEEASLIEPGTPSNRLTRTRVGNGLNQSETYRYTDAQGADAHGCMTAIDTFGGFEMYREFNGNGSAISLERESLHVMDNKQRIALVETQTIENGNALVTPAPLQRYQLGNHLSSAILELADDGALISYEEYHPYGTTAFQAGRTAAEISLKRYRYTGKERDDETSFYYHGARYYAPWLGRWMSADPAGLVDGTNMYGYARSSPTRLSDPSGRMSKKAQAEYEKARHADSQISPDQIGDVYRNAEDAPKYFDQPAKPTPAKALEQQRRLAQGEAKRAQAKAEARPLTKQIVKERREAEFKAAQKGMWNAVVDTVASSYKLTLPGSGGVIDPIVDLVKAAPPAPTGDQVRDSELKESFEGGETVANTVMFATSFIPAGEIAQGARLAAGKLPALEGIGMGGGGRLIGFSEQWVAEEGMLFHEHHVFPQQFAEEFKKLGIDVHDYAIKIPAQQHMRIHTGGIYNWEFQEFFYGSGARPTVTGAQNLAMELLAERGIVFDETLQFQRYSKALAK